MEQLYSRYKQALQGMYTAHEISIIFRTCVADVLQVEEQKTYFLSDLTYTKAQIERLQDMLQQLARNTPIQYVLGYETFMGLRFSVTPDVLIPRPETAELVAQIIAQNKHREHLRILDIGTGSGCIAIALAHYLPQASVMAVDVSKGALQVAQKNAHSIGVNIQFQELDFLQQNQQLTADFDLVVSNPPYIRNAEKADMENNVLLHEPHTALFVPDNDPLLFYRAIAQFASTRPIPWVYLEINRAFGEETCQLFTKLGYKTQLQNDQFGNPRLVRAEKW